LKCKCVNKNHYLLSDAYKIAKNITLTVQFLQ